MVMKNETVLLISFIFFLTSFFSCSQKPSDKEIQTIKKYTEHESHDSLLRGKWMNNATFRHQGKTSKIALSFDERGINNERMFVEDKPFNEWHFMYYYYTHHGKIFFYRPAEKGFMAMDGEIFSEYEYEISGNGKLLRIGEESYTKIE